ncbi:MAG: carboxypeptidase regulatory-like domain-containing protein, partial [Rubricoccaceae bacterium]|nr:carboxypeptidase regulatory-like domain-containing protein [Rubricoccaceae bacterium]
MALAAPSIAQQRVAVSSVVGQVVDANTAEGLPSASVAVWRLPENARGDTTLATGAISDETGHFRIAGLRGGTYRIVISFVGFETQTVEDLSVARGGQEVDLGVIELVADYAALDAVDVVSERERVEYQIDRTVYRTADDPLSQSGSATTVL